MDILDVFVLLQAAYGVLGATLTTRASQETGVFYLLDSKIEVYLPDHGQIQIVHNYPGNLTDLAFGPNMTMFWTDMSSQTVYMLKLTETFHGDMEEIVVDTGLLSPNGIAVDWGSHVLYIVDTQPGEIIVCSLRGDNCAILLSSLQNPHSIVVDHNKRALYWSAWGVAVPDGGIYSSGLDGSAPSPLVQGIARPSSLVLDPTLYALFWLSAPRGDETYTIQMLHLKDLLKQNVFTFPNSGGRPSFFLYMGHLNVQDGSGSGIGVDLTTFKEGPPSVEHMEWEGPVKVFNQSLNLAGKTGNLCMTSPCSHLCVHSNSNPGYRCLCPLDMNLTSQTKCQRSSEPRLLTSGLTKPGIYEVPLRYIGQAASRPKPLTTAETGAFAFGPNQQIIVYHQNNHIEVITLKDPSNATVLYTSVPSVEGLALDENSGDIFWSSPQEHHIVRASLDGTRKETIVTGLDRPRGVAVDTTHRSLYICDWGLTAGILRCTTDGQECETVVPVPGGNPNHVVISCVGQGGQEHVLWTDSRLDYIGRLSLEHNETKMITLNKNRNAHPYAIAAWEETVFYTDLNAGLLHYFRTDTKMVTIMDIKLELGPLHSIAVYRYLNISSRVVPSVSPNVTPLLSKSNTSTQMPEKGQHSREPDIIPALIPEPEDFLWVAFVVLGISLTVLVIIAGICYYRNMRKKNWLGGFIQYVREKPRDDIEQLMAHSASSNPSFQNLEDLDYPDWETRRRSLDLKISARTREYSSVSVDSAFTEMQDFRNSSAESVSQ